MNEIKGKLIAFRYRAGLPEPQVAIRNNLQNLINTFGQDYVFEVLKDELNLSLPKKVKSKIKKVG